MAWCCYLFYLQLCAWGRVWGYDHVGMCSRPVLDWVRLASAALCRIQGHTAAWAVMEQHHWKGSILCKNSWLLKLNSVWMNWLKSPVIILSWSVFFSVHRRARTTSQRRKCVTPSHHPTSSTIIFIIIKRTNAETNTIILPWQKKKKMKSKKKHSHWKSSSFLQDKSFMTIYCKCHVINVMCWM